MARCGRGQRVRAAKAGVQAFVMVRCHLQREPSYYEELIEKFVDSYVAFGWCLDEHTAVVLCLDVCRGFIYRYSPVEQRKTRTFRVGYNRVGGMTHWRHNKLVGYLGNSLLESQPVYRRLYPAFPQSLQLEQKGRKCILPNPYQVTTHDHHSISFDGTVKLKA